LVDVAHAGNVNLRLYINEYVRVNDERIALNEIEFVLVDALTDSHILTHLGLFLSFLTV
jgi:hypothetical protein